MVVRRDPRVGHLSAIVLLRRRRAFQRKQFALGYETEVDKRGRTGIGCD
jgi:hypothetical protein